ncbi:MAG TPA: hypothetical protein VI193_05640 [Acidimicrobiia bacterium]
MTSIGLTVLGLLLVGCGAGEDVVTTSLPSTTTSTTSSPESTTTNSLPVTTTTTVAESTTTLSSGLPGDPIDFGPAEGDVLGVIGVAHDDVLNLRAVPGADQAILVGIPPLFSDLIALGSTRQLAASMWIEVDYSGLTGWVNLRFIAYLGATSDVTADVVSSLGETPVAPTMPELGLLVAEHLVADNPDASFVMSGPATVGDLGEVTYDIVGFGDDSVRGTRIHVFGEPVDDGFALNAVEATPFCSRGVTPDGVCL